MATQMGKMKLDLIQWLSALHDDKILDQVEI